MTIMSEERKPIAWLCRDDRYPYIRGIVTDRPTTMVAWRDAGISFVELVPVDEVEELRGVIVGLDDRCANYERQCEQQRSQLDSARKVLEPFAAVAECDIGSTETDEDIFQPMRDYNHAPRITVGHMRAAKAALTDDTGKS